MSDCVTKRSGSSGEARAGRPRDECGSEGRVERPGGAGRRDLLGKKKWACRTARFCFPSSISSCPLRRAGSVPPGSEDRSRENLRDVAKVISVNRAVARFSWVRSLRGGLPEGGHAALLESLAAFQGATRMSTSLLYHGFGVRGYEYVGSCTSRDRFGCRSSRRAATEASSVESGSGRHAGAGAPSRGELGGERIRPARGCRRAVPKRTRWRADQAGTRAVALTRCAKTGWRWPPRRSQAFLKFREKSDRPMDILSARHKLTPWDEFRTMDPEGFPAAAFSPRTCGFPAGVFRPRGTGPNSAHLDRSAHETGTGAHQDGSCASHSCGT